MLMNELLTRGSEQVLRGSIMTMIRKIGVLYVVICPATLNNVSLGRVRAPRVAVHQGDPGDIGQGPRRDRDALNALYLLAGQRKPGAERRNQRDERLWTVPSYTL
jgi:hypothetical protein